MAQQFDRQGRPYGYGQYSPFTDKPSNVAQAVAGPKAMWTPETQQQQQPPAWQQKLQTQNTGINGGLALDQQKPAALPYQAKGKALGLEGFDQNKLQSGHVSPKYVFARHAQGLGVDDRDELLNRLKSDPSGYFANASFGGSKGDKLIVGGQLDPKFEGINTFDVVRAMGNGGEAWQWGAEGPNAGGQKSNVANAIFPPAVLKTGMTPQAQGLGGGGAARDWLNQVLGQLNKLRY